MSASEPTVEQTRNVAVDHHGQVVDRFEDYCRAMASDRFANAFTYGRFKVDVALDAELKRLPVLSRTAASIWHLPSRSTGISIARTCGARLQSL